MNNPYKQAQSLVKAESARALLEANNDTEQALDLLREWGESDPALSDALALVGCHTAINAACLELMEV